MLATIKLGHPMRGRRSVPLMVREVRYPSKSRCSQVVVIPYEDINTSLCFANRDCDGEVPLLHEIVIIVSNLRG
jgi:hypothetical protein